MDRHSLLRLAAAALVAAACGGDGPTGLPPAGTPTQLSFGAPPSLTAQSGIALPTQPSVRLRDASNKLVARAGVVVTATVGGAGATLANPTATTDGSGTASFTALTLTGLVGNYTLHFSAAGLTGLDAPALALAAGAVSQLAVAVAPSTSAQAGVALAAQPQIQLRDASGNDVPLPGFSIAASLFSGTATITSAIAQTNAAGRAVFSGLTLSGATGSYTLRFTSGAAAVAPVDAAGPTVLAAGPPTQLALSTQPSAAATNGTALATQPVVQLRDAFGNNTTGLGVVVVASIVSGPAGAAIKGDTATTDASGKATFTGLIITGATGNYSLRFASATLSSVVSAAATALAPGAATQIAVTIQPAGAATNAATLPTQPAVQLLDQSGNAVAQAGVVVTAAITTGTGTLASATATTNAQGTATFAGLTITGTAGFIRLQFSALSMAPVNSISIVLGAGAATALAITRQPATAATNAAALAAAAQPIVRLVDVSGNAVSLPGVVVTATVVSGSVSLASATATTSASGVATFAGLGITATVGSYTFRFTASGLTSVDASVPTVLSPGAATQLGLTVQPAAAGSSGAALAPAAVVQLRDVSGNAVSQPGVLITASVVGGAGSVSGATATTTAGGAATFSSLAITGTAGAYTLRFSATGLTPVDASSGTMLGAGAASQLAVTTQPDVAAQSGAALTAQPVVQIVDGGGNAVAQGGTLVTASVVSGTVTIGSATATTTPAGTAIFSGLTLTGVIGSYTFHFTASGLTAVNAAAPTVLSAGAASQLVVATQPAAAAQAGVALLQQPAIQLQDASGNAAAQNGVVVTASVVSGSVIFGNVTATTDPTGLATFNGLSLAGTAGSYTLRFTAPSLTAVNAAAATVLSAGPASVLALATQPSVSGNVAAALATQPVVQLKDGSGNLVSQAGVVVTASVVSGSVMLGGVTATTDPTGKATFSGLALTALIGSYTLRFTSPSLTAINAAAATTLAAGSPSELTLTVSPSVTASNNTALPTQPVVQVRDAGGNAVNAGGVLVTATTSGGVIASGNTATSNGTGVATFAGLTLTGTVGTYALTFGASGLTPVTAGGTSLAPGAPASLTIITPPPTTTQSGVPFATPPVIEVADISGNLVPGVTVSVDAPGSSPNILLANHTAVTGSNGRATFTNLTLSAPLSGYSLRFCTVSNCALGGGIIIGSPTPTSVTTGPVAILAVTTEASVTGQSGVALAVQPVVHVTDDGDNPVGGQTVTASLTPPGAVVAGPGGSAVSDVNGDATFSGLTISGAVTSGPYTLRYAVGPAAVNAAAPTALSAGVPSVLTITTQPPAAPINGVQFSTSPVVMVTDAAGNPIGGMTVTATIASCGASLSGTTAVTIASGVATFAQMGLTGTVGNSCTVQFQAGALAPVSANASVLSTGGPAAISLSTQPDIVATNGIALGIQPVVHVKDAFNNSVPGAIVTATAAGATIVNGSATTDVFGDAHFSGLVINGPAGSYTFQFSSGGVTVNAAAATLLATGAASVLQMVLQPSATGRSGVVLVQQPRVKITDAGGTTITGFAAVITASVVGGSATLSGTVTANVNTGSGIASFNNLRINALAGSSSLRFTSGTMTPVTASATTISAGVAAKLAVLTPPSLTSTVDSVLAQQPVVQILDGAGNAVDTPGINVTAAVVCTNGTAPVNCGSPSLTGTTLAATTPNGRGAFGGLTLTPAGDYRLRFTATGLTGVNTTDSIVVAAVIPPNVPQPNLTGLFSTAQTVVVDVMPGDTILNVVLSSDPTSTGDADLYVRYGAAPDIANGIHDCFPNLSGSNEVCTFRNPAPGKWYISIYAFLIFTNVTLTVYVSGH